MRDMFKFQYNPARHNGEVNHAGEVTYDYVGVIVDKFENQTEGEDLFGGDGRALRQRRANRPDSTIPMGSHSRGRRTLHQHGASHARRAHIMKLRHKDANTIELTF